MYRGPSARLDLAAQVGDVGAQDLHVVGVLDSPDLDQQRAVGHQPAAVLGQRPQQLELGRGQVDRLAVAAHGPCGEVDLEALGDDRGSEASGLARRSTASSRATSSGGPKGLVT